MERKEMEEWWRCSVVPRHRRERLADRLWATQEDFNSTLYK
jgi:hypothetical protein